MTRQEILDVLFSMRGCRGGLVQTPEQLRFSLYALTVAMTSMPFLNSSSDAHNNQVNGMKNDNGNGIADANDKSYDDNVASDDKTSNIISVDSADEDAEVAEYLKNGGGGGNVGENKSNVRKRSTTEDDATSMDLKITDDDVVVSDGVGLENGTQAKRSKPAQNQDW